MSDSFVNGLLVYGAVSLLAVIIICGLFELSERKSRKHHSIFVPDDTAEWRKVK